MPVRYPPLAEVSEVEDRLQRPITGNEVVRAEAVLNSVSIKARRETGRLWLVLGGDGEPVMPYEVDQDNLPETVWDIVVTASERALRNPDGYSSESTGDYSYQRVGIPGGVGGLYLTDEEVEALRAFRPSADTKVGGLWTLQTTRNEWYEDAVWYRTRPGTEPIALDSREFFGWT